MAIFSTLRSRRLATQKNKTTRQIIGFRLSREWFALPILAIHKVIPFSKSYGDPHSTGVSITSYDGQEILVIDVAQTIFQNRAILATKTLELEQPNLETILEQERYLLILHSEEDNLVGLPIDSKPTMYRVEDNAFKALPDKYLEQGNIDCLSSEIIEIDELPPLFLLDTQKLLDSIQ